MTEHGDDDGAVAMQVVEQVAGGVEHLSDLVAEEKENGVENLRPGFQQSAERSGNRGTKLLPVEEQDQRGTEEGSGEEIREEMEAQPETGEADEDDGIGKRQRADPAGSKQDAGGESDEQDGVVAGKRAFRLVHSRKSGDGEVESGIVIRAQADGKSGNQRSADSQGENASHKSRDQHLAAGAFFRIRIEPDPKEHEDHHLTAEKVAAGQKRKEGSDRRMLSGQGTEEQAYVSVNGAHRLLSCTNSL